MFYLAYLGGHGADAAAADPRQVAEARPRPVLLARALGTAGQRPAPSSTARSSRSTSPGRAPRSTTPCRQRTGTSSGPRYCSSASCCIIGCLYYFIVQAREVRRTCSRSTEPTSRSIPAPAGDASHDRRGRVRLRDRRRRHRRLRGGGAPVRGPVGHRLPDRGRPVRRRRPPSCGSRTGCTCSTRATTGTTWSSPRRRATASCATRAPRCSAAAPRTTRASPSGRRRRISTSGRRRAAPAGARPTAGR